MSGKWHRRTMLYLIKLKSMDSDLVGVYSHFCKELAEFFLCNFRAFTCIYFIVFVNCTFGISKGSLHIVLGLIKSGRYFFLIFIFLKILLLLLFLSFTYFIFLFLIFFHFVSFLFLIFLQLIVNKNFKIY